MTLEAARAILAVPPFPAATPYPHLRQAARMGHGGDSYGVTPGALIMAMRRQKVGGKFWLDEESPAAPLRTGAHDPKALLEAIRGRAVIAEGEGPYAALSGLEPGSPPTEAALETIVARELLEEIDFCSPFTGETINPLNLIEILGDWRALIEENRSIAAAFGFARWKQDTVEPLLWGGRAVPFRKAHPELLDALDLDDRVAIWKARVPPSFLARLEAGPWTVLEVEDGFIRSAGLGADCVPPLSVVVDDLGVHYDPARANRLEHILAQGDFPPHELARAQALREWLVRENVSKYGVGAASAPARSSGDKRHILVVGQVEDDRSVQFGGGEVRSNVELLRRVRALEPDAHIVYRPHPDVEAGHRRGAIPQRMLKELADAVDAASAIGGLIDMADEIHVITSLAGFEALMRGKAVTTHGTPFFAGWGLTRDLAPSTGRRDRSRTLDELVAATLLRYPRYLDPVTNLPCPAEIMIMRLLAGNRRRNGALVPLRHLFGWMKRAGQRLLDMR